MTPPSQPSPLAGRTSAIALCGVIAVAVVGFFVGIHDGVPQEDDDEHRDLIGGTAVAEASETIPAVSYADMRRRENGPTSRWNPSLEQLPRRSIDLFAEIQPSLAEKQQSLLTRASRRAFNGAPPVIPHSVENTSDSACYACHGQGLRIGEQVANRMSHEFLANCLQCHAPPPPKPFADVDAEVDNRFAGLPTPLAGERAFAGAPPTIPHSTWMREQCLACHGNEAGWAGLQTTHPWRSRCLQCHAPSAELEQAVSAQANRFLPAPDILDE